MGWTDLLDEKDSVIGVVGDPVWDIMAQAVENIANTYNKMWGRLPTQTELESILDFVLLEGENVQKKPDQESAT